MELGNMGQSSDASKVRTLRMVRLIRLFRMAKVARMVADMNNLSPQERYRLKVQELNEHMNFQIHCSNLELAINVISANASPLLVTAGFELIVEFLQANVEVGQADILKYFERNTYECVQFFRTLSTQLETELHTLLDLYEFDPSRLLLLLRFLQLMCEHHNLQSQTLMREQEGDSRVNIVRDVVTFLPNLIDSDASFTSFNDARMQVVIAMLNFIVEATQGPCVENQNLVAHNSSFLESCRIIIDVKRDDSNELDLQVKHQAIMLLSALIEGRRDHVIQKVFLQKFFPSLFQKFILYIHEEELKLKRKKRKSTTARLSQVKPAAAPKPPPPRSSPEEKNGGKAADAAVSVVDQFNVQDAKEKRLMKIIHGTGFELFSLIFQLVRVHCDYFCVRIQSTTCLLVRSTMLINVSRKKWSRQTRPTAWKSTIEFMMCSKLAYAVLRSNGEGQTLCKCTTGVTNICTLLLCCCACTRMQIQE
jgi:hypothetical protein